MNGLWKVTRTTVGCQAHSAADLLDRNRYCLHSVFRTRTGLEMLFLLSVLYTDHLCGLTVKVPGYRSRGPGLIPGATTIPEK
jgi:hypothetical protein